MVILFPYTKLLDKLFSCSLQFYKVVMFLGLERKMQKFKSFKCVSLVSPLIRDTNKSDPDLAPSCQVVLCLQETQSRQHKQKALTTLTPISLYLIL